MSHNPYGCEMRRKGVSAKYLNNFFSCRNLEASLNGKDNDFYELACKAIVGDMDTYCNKYGLMFSDEVGSFGNELQTGLVVVCLRCEDGDFMALDIHHRLVMGQVGIEEDEKRECESTVDETEHDPYDCEIKRKGVSAKHLDDFHEYQKLDESLNGEDDQFLKMAFTFSLSEMGKYCAESGLLFSYDLSAIKDNLKVGLLVACPQCALADAVAVSREDTLAMAQVEFRVDQTDQETPL